MSIETSAVYTNDLNPAFPTGAEAKSDGDDHLRITKATAKNTLPGFEGAAMVTGADGGVVNAYTLSPSTTLKSYTARTLAIFTPNITNTGAATLNVSGLGVKAIVAVDGAALASGDLTAGRTVAAVYDGTQFRLLSVSKQYIDQLVISGTVPGVDAPANAGKFFSTDGSVGRWTAIDLTVLPGETTFNKGNSSTAAQIVNYLEGGKPCEGQTITATGNFNLSASGFPAGRIAGVLLRAINWGAFTGITSTGITWIKADKSKATDFAASGIILPATGEAMLALFSYGDGTIYGKAA